MAKAKPVVARQRAHRKLQHQVRKDGIAAEMAQTLCIDCKQPMTKKTRGLGTVTKAGHWRCPACTP